MPDTATRDMDFTPDEAAKALADLPAYEERLTLRTAGLTWILWGLLVPGIFLSYEAATRLASPGTSLGTALAATLWIPWVLAGMVATATLWRTHAVSLRAEDAYDGRDGALIGLGYTTLFLVLLGLLSFLGAPLESHATPLLVTGLFTMAMATFQGRYADAPALPGLAGGALLAAEGLAFLQLLPDPASPGAALLAAGSVGVVYLAVGLDHVRRG